MYVVKICKHSLISRGKYSQEFRGYSRQYQITPWILDQIFLDYCVTDGHTKHLMRRADFVGANGLKIFKKPFHKTRQAMATSVWNRLDPKTEVVYYLGNVYYEMVVEASVFLDSDKHPVQTQVITKLATSKSKDAREIYKRYIESQV